VAYFPAGPKADLVATVTARPGGSRSRARGEIPLRAILRRQNDNDSYRPTPVPEGLCRRLEAYAVEPELRLELTGDPLVHRWIERLTVEADRVEFADPAFRRELGAWISQGAFGTPHLLSRLGALAVSRLDLGEAVARQDRELVESAPLLGLILAAKDDHLTHVKAGQLFERVWLAATTMGLSVHPMSQTMRHAELRAAVAELVEEPGWKPVHLFRLGFARRDRGPGHRTPRRPVHLGSESTGDTGCAPQQPQ
jgi:hypothetical protein